VKGQILTSKTIVSGGVDTVECGAVSGELVVTTTVRDGRAVTTVSYAGSPDVYTVTGSGGETTLDEDSLAERVSAHLGRTFPQLPNGNVPVVSLVGFNLDG
jgi:hypothetical protein